MSPVLLGEKVVTARKGQPLVLAPLWKAVKMPGTQEEIISLQISQGNKQTKSLPVLKEKCKL